MAERIVVWRNLLRLYKKETSRTEFLGNSNSTHGTEISQHAEARYPGGNLQRFAE
jgi:hypothetical protein